MGGRNVYIPDTLQDLLEHEGRVNPGNTQGRLLVALAREALTGTPAPSTATGKVVRALAFAPAAGLDVPELADRAGLSRRLVGETLALLSRLTPAPVEVVSGAGRDARWARANPAESEADASRDAA